MSWRAMNRRRRERSRYAGLGVQTTSASFPDPVPARLVVMTLDMIDSDALDRYPNRTPHCCRGLALGQALWTNHRAFLVRYLPQPNHHLPRTTLIPNPSPLGAG